MQQKRNIRLLISLIVLITITMVTFVAFNNDQEEVVDKDIFRIADYSQIDKVVLIKNGLSVELKFDGTRWKVNDQLADRTMIDVLFATLQQAEPKRPVAESLQDSINLVLNNQGVKVSLYHADELQQEFLAGGNSTKTQAYFKKPTEKESFLMVIPGYRVYASGIFELEENGWRDKYVFNFNWRNFQSLKSAFPDNQKNNFEVAMGKAYFEIKGLSSIDTTKLNDYLDAVSLLTVDEYVNREAVEGYDNLVRSKPILELLVTDVSGKSYSLALYEPASGTNLLGIIGGSQPAFFDKRKVTGILNKKDWFVRK